MIDKLLKKLDACFRAREWAKGKSWEELYATCPRGDWLLWLFSETQENRKLLTLAKGHCSNTVRHLMTDKRSRDGVDTAIAFGEGKASLEELRCAYASAYTTYTAAAASASSAFATASDAFADAFAAAYAADAAASAADASADASSAASAAADADAYADADADYSKRANRLLTADICRKYLPFEIWDVKDDESEVKE